MRFSDQCYTKLNLVPNRIIILHNIALCYIYLVEFTMNLGTLFWITGLSGAGKTTVARELYRHLMETAQYQPLVILDGDELRNVIGQDLGYTSSDRFQSAMRNARLCHLLVTQGINVICATISLFHACQRWNRTYISNYVEIYIDVPWSELVKRDSKQIYANAIRNKQNNSNKKIENNIVGLDLAMEAPEAPDLTIANYGITSPQDAVKQILTFLAAKNKVLIL